MSWRLLLFAWQVIALEQVPVEPESWALTLVDVPSLVCNSSEDTIQIQLDEPIETDAPYFLSFFRTSPAAVNLTFSLRSADGQIVAPKHSVLLEDVSGHKKANLTAVAHSLNPGERRMSESDVLGSNCEDFFLYDGRSPIDLPDTWFEAREAFRDMCEAESESVARCRDIEEAAFNGYPEGHESLESDGLLCTRLFDHSAVFFPGILQNPYRVRRLKSFGAVGYKSAKGRPSAGTYQNTGNPNAGLYGYSTVSLARRYPTGATRSGYGYVGRGGLAPYHRRAGVVTVAVIVGYSSFRWSRGSTRCFGNRCNGTIGGACSAQDPCEFPLGDDEDLTRDDILDSTGFRPDQHPGPYTLEIHRVIGDHFNPDRICPTDTWQGEHDPSWSLPDQQDLFVAISRAESMVEEKSANVAVIIIISIIVGIPVVICCCMCLLPGRPQPSTVDEEDEHSRREGVKVGDRVQGMRSDGKYYDATIVEILEGEEYRLTWDDGEKAETIRPLTHLQIKAAPVPNCGEGVAPPAGRRSLSGMHSE